jgi:hypothetical protein
MGRRIPERIPQYFASPVTLERLESKAFSGSYKATEYLLSLLEFTAIAVLGGDPFTDLLSGEMEDRLREKYIACCKSPLAQYDPISMAMVWAWPPIEGRIIVFDCEELMNAIEALCLLLKSVEPAAIIQRLSEKYIKEEMGEQEFIELGEAMKCLGVSREIVENATDVGSVANHLVILRGYDKA